MRKPTVMVIYEFLQTYIDRYRYPPSIREIASGCYLSPTTVAYHLDKLEAQGKILRRRGRARGIILILDADEGSAQVKK